MNPKDTSTNGYRRHAVLVLSISLLCVCGWMYWIGGSSGTERMVAAATGRIGLVLGALWMAWPSLLRPASWLPPGFAVLGVFVLAVLAAHPRLIVVLLPAFGGLLVFATVVRAMRP